MVNVSVVGNCGKRKSRIKGSGEKNASSKITYFHAKWSIALVNGKGNRYVKASRHVIMVF